MKTPNHYCIQCEDRTTGSKGDFAYHDSDPFVALSPIFTDLGKFYEWAKSQGLEPGPLGSFTLVQLR